MKVRTTLMASCALAIMGAAAYADCADELAAISGESSGSAMTQGIAKDGSLAPLEDPSATKGPSVPGAAEAAVERDGEASVDTATAPETDIAAMPATAGVSTDSVASGDGIAKDGSHVPLEEETSGNADQTAMSGQDASAQQDGEPTAAGEAANATGADSTSATDPATSATEDQGSRGTTMSGDADRAAVISRAENALASGDEDACMAAVEEFKAM